MFNFRGVFEKKGLLTPLKFNSSPLKNDGWKAIFRGELLILGRVPREGVWEKAFGYVGFWQGKGHIHTYLFTIHLVVLYIYYMCICNWEMIIFMRIIQLRKGLSKQILTNISRSSQIS